MNTSENNHFQIIINFVTSLTLSSSPNRRKQFDISLKKGEKKKGENPTTFSTFFFFFFF